MPRNKVTEEVLGHPGSMCPRCGKELNLYLMHETVEYMTGPEVISMYQIRCQKCTFKMKEADE